jgi:hypothetical protein
VVEEVMESGVALFPAFSRLRSLRQCGGAMDMSMDGSPIIDRTPIEDLFLNCGWCCGGFKATPASGWCFAHTIATGAPHALNAGFRLDRFTTGAVLPVTDAWAQVSIAGPRARELPASALDPGTVLSNEALPQMACTTAAIGGVPACCTGSASAMSASPAPAPRCSGMAAESAVTPASPSPAAARWTIPAQRAKNGQALTVPPHPLAVESLRQAWPPHGATAGEDWKLLGRIAGSGFRGLGSLTRRLDARMVDLRAAAGELRRRIGWASRVLALMGIGARIGRR